MKTSQIITILGIILSLVVSVPILSDQVILKDGGVVQGTVVDQTEDKVVVEDIDGVRSSYGMGDVERVVKDTRGAVAPGDAGMIEQVDEKPELVIQRGHSNWIMDIAYSPDGKMLASAGYDNTVKLWDITTGELLYSLQGHTQAIFSIVYSPDGKILASADGGNIIKLWDTSTGRLLFSIEGNMESIIFSPNGDIFASASGDSNVKLWDTKTGVLMNSLKGHADGINAIAFSPNGNTIASGSNDGTVRLWNSSTGEELHVFSLQHRVPVWCITFSHDGKALAAGSQEGMLKIWDTATKSLLYSLEGHTWGVTAISYSPDGKSLSSGSNDSSIIIWDTANGSIKYKLDGPYNIDYIAYSPDGKYLVSGGSPTYMVWNATNGERMYSIEGFPITYSPDGDFIASARSWDNAIEIRDTETGGLKQLLSGHDGSILFISYSPDGASFVTGYVYTTIKLWDAANGDLLFKFEENKGDISSIIYSQNGKLLVTAGTDDIVNIWNTETGELLHAIHVQETIQGPSIHLSPDGRTLAIGGNKIMLWDIETETLLHTLDAFGQFDYSPNREILAAEGENGTIILWDTLTGKRKSLLKGHTGYIGAITFSPDGKTLATGGYDNTVRLWDTTNGELLHSLDGHVLAVLSIDFSGDGKLLATAGHDKTIKLWDSASGTLLRSLEGHSGSVHDIAFSPEDKFLVSSSTDDGTIKIWDFINGVLLHSLQGKYFSFSPDGHILASTDGDTVRFWNLETGQLLATQISFNDGNWFVQDSAGRFDCSGCTRGEPNNGKKYIRWRVDNKLYAPDQFFRRYFEPGLFEDVIEMGYVPPMEDMGTALKTPPPDVAFEGIENRTSTDSTNIQVKVQITEYENGGAENIRLFVNGRPVAEPPKDVTSADVPEGQHLFEFTASLAPGENNLMALATSRSGIDSRQAEITVISTQPAERPDLFLVTVGIDEYANTNLNLRLAVADADGFADELISKGTALYSRIHDIRLRNAAATGENLRRALEDIQKKATFNDIVIIFYAGHGANMGGGWYLLTHDIEKTDKNYVAEHAFSDLELKAFLKRVKAGKVVLVMDACYSGAVPQMLAHGISKDKFLIQLAYGTGTSVIAASTDTQKAQETGDLGHGIFTYFLLDGMEGKADGAVDGTTSSTVEVRELGEYTTHAVPEYTEDNYMRRQEPFFWQVAGGGSLGPSIVEVK